MPLHPHIRGVLLAAAGAPAVETLSVAEARAQAKARYQTGAVPAQVEDTTDLSIPGPEGPLRIRLYRPARAEPEPLPVLVFFHGSGFVLLDIDSHDAICRQLCVGAHCLVASVDYRLAPEHPFPAAPDDCLAATRWIAEHAGKLDGDPSRLAVSGDSAGACLAVVTALRIRDKGGPELRGQLLFYPVTDYPVPPTATHREFASGYGLTYAALRWYWNHYLPDPADADDPSASPLRARSLAGLPPALVMTAEYDVLRDEGERYADRLRTDGVPAVLQRCEGMNHGFLKFLGIVSEADRALAEACAWLRQTLAAPVGSTGASRGR